MIIHKNHPFYKLSNKKKLARILKVDVRSFKNINENYLAKKFIKTTNKKRTFYNASVTYKKVLRLINYYLQKIDFPHYIYSGISNRNCLKNATVHFENQYLCNIDITNFFPSTNESYVYGFFKNKFQMSTDIAKILTLLTTYPDENGKRHIPQGFPTSTILSYLCYYDMFNGIYEFSIQRGITFSVFVDDLTFSANKHINKSFNRKIIKIIENYNLKINPEKVRYYLPIHHKKITGIIVNSKKEIKATNKLQENMIKNFHEILDCNFKHFSGYITFKKNVLRLRGQLNWIYRIEPDRNFAYINKTLIGIENNFLNRTVKQTNYNELKKEYEVFKNRYKIKGAKARDR